MRPATPALHLTPGQRDVLEILARSTSATHREVLTAQALLLANDGLANTAIAKQVGVAPDTVKAWRRRFAEDGLGGIGKVRPGRGRKRVITDEQVAEVVRMTLQETPPGQTHWSTRTMADAAQISSASVQRIWSGLGIKPHLTETFKVSGDPGL